MNIRDLSLWAFLTVFCAASASGVPALTIRLEQATVLEPNGAIEWKVALSNTTPTAIHFSQFSLGNLVRRTKMTDAAGRTYRIIAPEELIHPAQPEIDYKHGIPGYGTLVITIQTDRIEIERTKATTQGNGTEHQPSRFSYEVAGEVSVSVDWSKKPERWKCRGNGSVEFKPRTQKANESGRP